MQLTDSNTVKRDRQINQRSRQRTVQRGLIKLDDQTGRKAIRMLRMLLHRVLLLLVASSKHVTQRRTWRRQDDIFIEFIETVRANPSTTDIRADCRYFVDRLQRDP